MTFKEFFEKDDSLNLQYIWFFDSNKYSANSYDKKLYL